MLNVGCLMWKNNWEVCLLLFLKEQILFKKGWIYSPFLKGVWGLGSKC